MVARLPLWLKRVLLALGGVRITHHPRPCAGCAAAGLAGGGECLEHGADGPGAAIEVRVPRYAAKIADRAADELRSKARVTTTPRGYIVQGPQPSTVYVFVKGRGPHGG